MLQHGSINAKCPQVLQKIFGYCSQIQPLWVLQAIRYVRTYLCWPEPSTELLPTSWAQNTCTTFAGLARQAWLQQFWVGHICKTCCAAPHHSNSPLLCSHLRRPRQNLPTHRKNQGLCLQKFYPRGSRKLLDNFEPIYATLNPPQRTISLQFSTAMLTSAPRQNAPTHSENPGLLLTKSSSTKRIGRLVVSSAPQKGLTSCLSSVCSTTATQRHAVTKALRLRLECQGT